MRNYLVLAVVAVGGLVNGLALTALPLWRQFLFVGVAGAAYLHGRYPGVARGWPVLAGVAVPAVGLMVADVVEWAGALACFTVFVVVPWGAGRFRRQQALLILELRRGRELAAEQARLRERARIAADMHDSLGHELALIALRAGGLELAPDMSEENRRAAAGLRESAVVATDRLRRTVGLLREATVVPVDEGLADLVERAVGAGMVVRLEDRGGALPELVGRAVHRVVQEGLTNAARHAPGSEVDVSVTRAAGEVAVRVVNALAGDSRAGGGGSRPADALGTGTGTGTGSGSRVADALGSGSGGGGSRVADGLGAGGSRVADALAGGGLRPPSPLSHGGTTVRGGAAVGSGLAGLGERVRLLGGVLRAGVEGDSFVVIARIPVGEGGR